MYLGAYAFSNRKDDEITWLKNQLKLNCERLFPKTAANL